MATVTSTLNVPNHVPPECVWEHDFAAFLAEGDDPFIAGGRLHNGPDIIWAPTAAHGGPAWIFTRHALIEEGFFDWEKFSSKRAANAAVMSSEWLLLPVEADRPDHFHYRQALQPLFSPSALKSRTSGVQALCDDLIDAFIDKGRCEFIGEFASILPNAIVISLLGMPQEMLREFLAWEHDVIHGETVEVRIAAGEAITAYLKGFIVEQRAKPDQATDVMRAILDGRLPERTFTDAEVLGFVYLLFVAGLDTVYNSLGWIMRHLSGDQVLQQRLRASPDLIPAAIDEYTRAFGVSAPSRSVANDMVFHGVPMRAGEAVLLPTFLAGRDPRAWINPHVVDIGRRPRHLTFGTGPHVCLGIHLAKREMRIMLESVLLRMRNIRQSATGSFEYHTTNTIGVNRLDLEWDLA